MGRLVFYALDFMLERSLAITEESVSWDRFAFVNSVVENFWLSSDDFSELVRLW